MLHLPQVCQAKHMGLLDSPLDAGRAGKVPAQIFPWSDLQLILDISLNLWNIELMKVVLLILVRAVAQPVLVLADSEGDGAGRMVWLNGGP